MNRRSLLIGAGAVTLASCATSARSRELALAPDIDAAAARVLAANYTPGLAIAVYTPDGVYARGHGVADLQTGQRAGADTVFYIASCTKPLTALALAESHQRGELDLGSTLSAYAPDAPLPEAVRPGEATLRHLLTHTSGIDNGPIGYRSAFTGQHDPETLWRLLAASEVNADAPLGTFEYTNVGYNIATVLTDRRLGVRWQDLLDREIFAPTGMLRASGRISRAVSEGWTIAKPHQMSPEGAPQRIYLEKTDQTMQSAGGIVMSAEDAVRWLELLARDGRVGSRQAVAPAALLATRERLAEVSADFMGYQRTGYGLGWYHGPYRDEPMLHHFGGFAGFAAHVSYLPAQRAAVAVFANDSSTGQAAIHAIANYAYDRIAGQADAGERFDASLAMATQMRERGVQAIARDAANRASRPWTLSRPREAYAGAYESDQWGRVEVAVEGEALNVSYGVLRATAEPFTQPDSIRVEFVPGSGEPMQFLGDGERPAGLRSRSGMFRRV